MGDLSDYVDLKKEDNSVGITCLNRILGICKNCERDYENHHPNNYDCQDYTEAHIIEVEIKGYSS